MKYIKDVGKLFKWLTKSLANDDLAKLDQLTIEEEKMEKDNDNIDVSKENYFNNKSLGKSFRKMMQLPNIFFSEMAL